MFPLSRRSTTTQRATHRDAVPPEWVSLTRVGNNIAPQCLCLFKYPNIYSYPSYVFSLKSKRVTRMCSRGSVKSENRSCWSCLTEFPCWSRIEIQKQEVSFLKCQMSLWLFKRWTSIFLKFSTHIRSVFDVKNVCNLFNTKLWFVGNV